MIHTDYGENAVQMMDDMGVSGKGSKVNEARWNGTEWNGIGAERDGMERTGMEWNGMERYRKQWTEMEYKSEECRYYP